MPGKKGLIFFFFLIDWEGCGDIFEPKRVKNVGAHRRRLFYCKIRRNNDICLYFTGKRYAVYLHTNGC